MVVLNRVVWVGLALTIPKVTFEESLEGVREVAKQVP